MVIKDQLGDIHRPILSALDVELRDGIGRHVHGLGRRLSALRLAVVGDGGTLAESGPLTQIELATTMSIDRTAMVYLLDELEEQSLVERVRHPQDRRAFLIHLTGGGRDTQRRAAAALSGAAETLLTPLDPAEREQLVDLLGKVAAHWQQVRAAQPDPPPVRSRWSYIS